MILADTTIVVDWLRAPTPRLLQIIQSHQAAICGVTLAEAYAGARTPQDFFDIDNALTVFANISIPDAIWPKLGRNLSALGAKGLTVPLSDALIAAVAIEGDLEVWQHDHHFPDMQKVLSQLKLFQEPP